MLFRSKIPVTLSFRALKERTEKFVLDWVQAEIGLKREDIGFAPEDVGKGRQHRVYINSFVFAYNNWTLYDNTNRPLPFQGRWRPFQRQQVRPQCLVPLLAMLVFSNGRVSYCNCDNFDDTEELRLGDANTTSLAQIFNSPRAMALWDWARVGVPEYCQKCSFHAPLDYVTRHPDVLRNPARYAGAG